MARLWERMYLDLYFLMTHQFATPQTGFVADQQITDRRPGVLETFELRWFASGRIPPAAIGWFESTAPHIVVEERIDSYLVTGRADIGVKRRNHGPLEVKERRRTGRQMSVGRLLGHVEEWHKRNWNRSPEAADRWIEIDKTVLTYPHRAMGTPGLSSGCDIELATIEAEGLEAWTFAFEAYGPAWERLRTLHASVEQFLADSDVPDAIAMALELEAGYPAWLAAIAGA